MNDSPLIPFDSITPTDPSEISTMPRVTAKYQSNSVVMTKFSASKESYFAQFTSDVKHLTELPDCRYVSRAIGGTATPDALFVLYEDSFPTTLDVGLSQLRRHHKRLSPETRVCAAFDIVRGLHFLHSHKIAHRHLRPSNIFFAGLDRRTTGLCKLTDYGASASSDLDTMEENVPLYIAPEVFGSCSVTTQDTSSAMKSDMFSFAIIAAELWNCAPPYNELNMADPWSLCLPFYLISHVCISPLCIFC